LFSPKRPYRLWGPYSFYSRGSSAWLKRSGSEADHSWQSSVKWVNLYFLSPYTSMEKTGTAFIVVPLLSQATAHTVEIFVHCAASLSSFYAHVSGRNTQVASHLHAS